VRSDEAWKIILRKTSSNQPGFAALERERIERVVLDPDLVLMTRSELRAALKDAFKEGQAFRKSQERPDPLGALSEETRRMAEAMSNIEMPLPSGVSIDPPKPPKTFVYTPPHRSLTDAQREAMIEAFRKANTVEKKRWGRRSR